MACSTYLVFILFYCLSVFLIYLGCKWDASLPFQSFPWTVRHRQFGNASGNCCLFFVVSFSEKIYSINEMMNYLAFTILEISPCSKLNCTSWAHCLHLPHNAYTIVFIEERKIMDNLQACVSNPTTKPAPITPSSQWETQHVTCNFVLFTNLLPIPCVGTI